jgi:hypothetical protein
LQSPNDVESEGVSAEPWYLGDIFNHQIRGNRVDVNLREW